MSKVVKESSAVKLRRFLKEDQGEGLSRLERAMIEVKSSIVSLQLDEEEGSFEWSRVRSPKRRSFRTGASQLREQLLWVENIPE